MWQDYILVASVDEALELISGNGKKSRIIAGGTDMMLDLETSPKSEDLTVIDISRLEGGDQIFLDDEGWIHLGPLVTHNHAISSELIVERAFPLAQACWEVGAPQIRNRGTIAGNLITASPANDTITPLLALGAQLTLKSKSNECIVPLDKFYAGVRKTLRLVSRPWIQNLSERDF